MGENSCGEPNLETGRSRLVAEGVLPLSVAEASQAEEDGLFDCLDSSCLEFGDRGIGNLALALSKAQGEMHGSLKGGENAFARYTYSTLDDIWRAARKPLADNELCIIQPIDGMTLVTYLVHSSGEWMKSSITMHPSKWDKDKGAWRAMEGDPQVLGSWITYCRKYGLAAMVGVCPGTGEDDDGAIAAGLETKKAAPKKAEAAKRKPAPATPPPEAVEPKKEDSQKVKTFLAYFCSKMGGLAEKDGEMKALAQFGLDNVNEITEENLQEARGWDWKAMAGK